MTRHASSFPSFQTKLLVSSASQSADMFLTNVAGLFEEVLRDWGQNDSIAKNCTLSLIRRPCFRKWTFCLNGACCQQEKNEEAGWIGEEIVVDICDTKDSFVFRLAYRAGHIHYMLLFM